MQKQKKVVLLFGLVITLALHPAQPNPSASSVLESINQVNIFQASFIYTSRETGNNKQEVQAPTSGQIWVKGVKYHLIWDEQEIVCNGQWVWSYLPQTNEVQICDYDPTQEALDPAKLLTMYRVGFVPVALENQVKEGRPVYIIELKSQDPDNWISRIKLTIEQKSKQIKWIEALDNNQYWHSFQITQFEAQKDLPDSCFEFDIKQHPQIEVVDLRP